MEHNETEMRSTKRSSFTLLLAAIVAHMVCTTCAHSIPSCNSPSIEITVNPPINPKAESQIHVVTVVSNGVDQVLPNTIEADVGDIVQFRFYPANHSVAHSNYVGSEACATTKSDSSVPYESSHPQKHTKEIHSYIKASEEVRRNQDFEVRLHVNSMLWLRMT